MRSLSIRNFAIVDEAELSLGPGLTVLTGETGAGKSLVVDALSLLLGARGWSDLVRGGEERAEVSAVFSLDAAAARAAGEAGFGDSDELLVRREVSRSGSGRAWVNGRPATVSVLAGLTGPLVDLHGQNEHVGLLSPSRQLSLLDRFAGCEAVADDCAAKTEAFQALVRAREELLLLAKDREKRMDFLAHQVREIERAQVRPGEDVELQAERARLRSAGKLADAARRAQGFLVGDDERPGALSGLAGALDAARSIAQLDPTASHWTEELSAAVAQADELSRAVRRYAEGLSSGEGRLEEIESRLSVLETLERRYGGDLAAVAAALPALAQELSGLEHLGDRTAEHERRVSAAAETLGALTRALSGRRQAAAAKLEARVARELEQLAMPGARLRVSLGQTKDPSSPVRWGREGMRLLSRGCDAVEFLLSANAGEGFLALGRAASGGELSRVMLALKTALADADPAPTLVFDEVDSGVGGPTGQVVGAKLSRLARNRQVLCVTHLPQIAAFADRHFYVTKDSGRDRTRASVRELSDAGRAEELARMLSGETVTAAARAQAAELLQVARARATRPG